MNDEEQPPTHGHPTVGGDGVRIPAVGRCPNCGQRDQYLDELTRRFGCPHCGLMHDERKAA